MENNKSISELATELSVAQSAHMLSGTDETRAAYEAANTAYYKCLRDYGWPKR